MNCEFTLPTHVHGVRFLNFSKHHSSILLQFPITCILDILITCHYVCIPYWIRREYLVRLLDILVCAFISQLPKCTSSSSTYASRTYNLHALKTRREFTRPRAKIHHILSHLQTQTVFLPVFLFYNDHFQCTPRLFPLNCFKDAPKKHFRHFRPF